jgi:hypothetical protein
MTMSDRTIVIRHVKFEVAEDYKPPEMFLMFLKIFQVVFVNFLLFTIASLLMDISYKCRF